MATITEDYVSFETAKLLKEKGFDIETEHEIWYVVKQFSTGCSCNSCTYKVGDITREYNEDCCISMPTLQMIMKWLREKGIYITIVYGDYPSLNKVFYTPQIDSLEGFDLPIDFYKEYDKYEEAEEAGIKYALENLI